MFLCRLLNFVNENTLLLFLLFAARAVIRMKQLQRTAIVAMPQLSSKSSASVHRGMASKFVFQIFHAMILIQY